MFPVETISAKMLDYYVDRTKALRKLRHPSRSRKLKDYLD